MKKIYYLKICCTLLLASMLVSTKSIAIDPTNIYPVVKLETSMGVILVELDRVKAPLTVDNFLSYVVRGEYNNTIFHRVLAEFVVQGGGYDKEYSVKKVTKNIANESGNGLKNELGTIAMAKENRPHSANRQFFFNVIDNPSLDPGRKWGYAVFGYVTEGQEVIEAISKVKTDYNAELGWDDVPLEPVMLIRATLLPSTD